MTSLRRSVSGFWLPLAAALALSTSCKDDEGEGGGSSESGDDIGDNSADNTGAPPCMTGLQPHGQCLEEVNFGNKAILQLRIGVFSANGRESIATQTVQTLSLGRLYADDSGTLVLQEGPALSLSAPWEIAVGRFHPGLDVDELMYIEPDFENFHFFRAISPGFALETSEPNNASLVGQNAIAFDTNADGIDELYEVSLSSARVLGNGGGEWNGLSTYPFNGGPLADAAVIFDMDQDGVDELVAPLAGNTASAYDPATHKFVGYAGSGGMLVVEGQFDAGDKPFSLDHGDFDGDGFHDLLVKGDDVGVLLSTPFGLGAHSSLALQGGVTSRARACDVDGDGIHEVVTMPQAGGGGLLIWFNVLGMPEIETAAMVTTPQELECPDLDGDGRDDIVYRDDTELHVLRPIPGS